MKRIILCISLLFFNGISLFPQLPFNGFDHQQCGLAPNPGYQDTGFYTCTRGVGYRIYFNGDLVFQKCQEYGGCKVLSMMFAEGGFPYIIESCLGSNISVYMYSTSGSWNLLGSGADRMEGIFLVNLHTGYLVTGSIFGDLILITRLSDIRQKIIMVDTVVQHDTLIRDTIFGAPFCQMDTLGFSVTHDQSVIHYKIILSQLPTNDSADMKKGDIKAFPDPAFDWLIFRKGGFPVTVSSLTLHDMTGKLVKTVQNLEGSELYIGDLKRGIYIMEVISGGTKHVSRLVKI